MCNPPEQYVYINTIAPSSPPVTELATFTAQRRKEPHLLFQLVSEIVGNYLLLVVTQLIGNV